MPGSLCSCYWWDTGFRQEIIRCRFYRVYMWTILHRCIAVLIRASRLCATVPFKRLIHIAISSSTILWYKSMSVILRFSLSNTIHVRYMYSLHTAHTSWACRSGQTPFWCWTAVPGRHNHWILWWRKKQAWNWPWSGPLAQWEEGGLQVHSSWRAFVWRTLPSGQSILLIRNSMYVCRISSWELMGSFNALSESYDMHVRNKPIHWLYYCMYMIYIRGSLL